MGSTPYIVVYLIITGVHLVTVVVQYVLWGPHRSSISNDYGGPPQNSCGTVCVMYGAHPIMVQ